VNEVAAVRGTMKCAGREWKLLYELVSVFRSINKKINNLKANFIEFAYIRIALKVILKISLNAIDALEFSISKYIRIEQTN